MAEVRRHRASLRDTLDRRWVRLSQAEVSQDEQDDDDGADEPDDSVHVSIPLRKETSAKRFQAVHSVLTLLQAHYASAAQASVRWRTVQHKSSRRRMPRFDVRSVLFASRSRATLAPVAPMADAPMTSQRGPAIDTVSGVVDCSRATGLRSERSRGHRRGNRLDMQGSVRIRSSSGVDLCSGARPPKMRARAPIWRAGVVIFVQNSLEWREPTWRRPGLRSRADQNVGASTSGAVTAPLAAKTVEASGTDPALSTEPESCVLPTDGIASTWATWATAGFGCQADVAIAVTAKKATMALEAKWHSARRRHLPSSRWRAHRRPTSTPHARRG